VSPLALAGLVLDYADAAGVRVAAPQVMKPGSIQPWPKVLVGEAVHVGQDDDGTWIWSDHTGNTRYGDPERAPDPTVKDALVWMMNKRISRARSEIEYLVEPSGTQSFTEAVLAAADRAIYAAQIGARFHAHPHSEGSVRLSVVVDDVVVEWSRREDRKHGYLAPWLVCDRHGKVLPPSAGHAHSYAFDAIRNAILIVARMRMEAALP